MGEPARSNSPSANNFTPLPHRPAYISDRETDRGNLSRGTHHTPTGRCRLPTGGIKPTSLWTPRHSHCTGHGFRPLHAFSHHSTLSPPGPRKRNAMPLPPSKMKSTATRTPFTPSLSLTQSLGPITPRPPTFRRFTPADGAAIAAAAVEARRTATVAAAAAAAAAAAPQVAPRALRRRGGPPLPPPIDIPVAKIEKVVRERVSTPRPPVAVAVTAAPANRRKRSCGLEGTGGFIRGLAQGGA